MRKNTCRKSTVTTYNAYDYYAKKYGKDAYEAWLRREEEITAIAKTRRDTVLDICHMRENNFRQMKAEGAKWAAAKDLNPRPPRPPRRPSMPRKSGALPRRPASFSR